MISIQLEFLLLSESATGGLTSPASISRRLLIYSVHLYISAAYYNHELSANMREVKAVLNVASEATC